MGSAYGGAAGISQAAADAAYVSLDGTDTAATSQAQRFNGGISVGDGSLVAGIINFTDTSAQTLTITALAPATARQVTLNGSGLTANRIHVLPDAAGTYVLDTATQTLTNKTLTAPVINTEPGYVALNAAYTNATSTFSSTALSVNVVSGRTYSFRMVLFVSDSTAADGLKIDFNGGSAAATDFRAHATLFDTALLLSTQVTALATAINQATVTGSGMFECYGTFVPSGSGTFIVRAAQNSHSVGTLTIQRGSHLHIKDVTAV